MADYVRFGTHNAVLPKEGPLVFSYNLNFAVNSEQTVDLTIPKEQGFVSFVQGWYIDNGKNNAPISVTAQGTGQTITIGANKQAYMPQFINDQPVLILKTTMAAGLIVPFFVTNVPVDAAVWNVT